MTKTEQAFLEIVQPIVEKEGYLLYDVMYIKEGADFYLRIFIDNDKGIGIDDCEKISNLISEKLDEVDPIDSPYILEVSSCGLERHLREENHYVSSIGKNIEVKFFKPIDNKKSLSGVLLECKSGKIVIKTEEERAEVNLSDISGAKILYNWEESENE